MKSETLSQFQDIISAIESESHEKFKQFEIYRCKIFLIDGSNLRVFEKYAYDRMIYYSYYVSPQYLLVNDNVRQL